MSLIIALLLGLLQGATEFLPVSSSGHLVLVPWLAGWPAPGLAFDALAHCGTAVAVIAYFWRDWIALAQGVWQALRTRALNPHARLAGLILLATVPGVLAGVLLKDFFEGTFAQPTTVAGLLLVTAGLLAMAERWAKRAQRQEIASWPDALIIGLAQALAILPGLSRSGATITAGIGRGLRREAAARFSFLLATPIILGAGVFKLLDLGQAGVLAQAPTLAVGFLAALVAGLVCIYFLLRYLQRRPLYPFAIYCASAGAICLLVSLLR